MRQRHFEQTDSPIAQEFDSWFISSLRLEVNCLIKFFDPDMSASEQGGTFLTVCGSNTQTTSHWVDNPAHVLIIQEQKVLGGLDNGEFIVLVEQPIVKKYCF